MNSREKILAAVKRNQPARQTLPDATPFLPIQYENVVDQFVNTVQVIGGNVISMQKLAAITAYVHQHFNKAHRLVTTLPALTGLELVAVQDPHALETVQLAVIEAQFGVAENGAVWVAEKEMQVRALPFIAQHLAVVLSSQQIVHNMHEAYSKIGQASYGFGTFIAGPSKTADIEQSLVLGAHGPAGMTIFLLD